MTNHHTEQLQKRTHVYVQSPLAFEIAPCKCGNNDPQWSEFQGRLWCEPCQIDFIPEHWGVLDGPVPVGCAQLMGASFDQINIETGDLVKFDPEKLP